LQALVHGLPLWALDSQQRARYNLTASGTSASVTAEGPVGTRPRGSWLVSGRRSYLDVFLKRVLHDSSIAFGFMDLFSKVVYDVSDRHQIQASLLTGRSRLDNHPDSDNLQALRTASHTGWMGTASDQKIDGLILSFAGARWKKMAMIVSEVFLACKRESMQARMDMIAGRVRRLVADGKLQSQGDLRKMRRGEVKLAH